MGNEYNYEISYFFLFFCYYLEDIDSFVENMLFVLYNMLIVINRVVI